VSIVGQDHGPSPKAQDLTEPVTNPRGPQVKGR